MKYLMCFLLSGFFTTDSLSDQNSIYSIGGGLGVIYGSIGVKVDYEFLNNTYITSGLGPAPSIGLQYYLRDKEVFWRPKIALHYGMVGFTRGAKEDPFNDPDVENYKVLQYFYGWVFEIGQSFQYGSARRHAFDLSLTIPMSDGGQKEWNDRHRDEYDYNAGVDFGEILNTICSFGYRYNF